MKLSKRIIALALSLFVVFGFSATFVSAGDYEYALVEVGELGNVNEDVTYQRYVLTSGENGTTVDAVALNFNSNDGYIPMSFMAYAGTSATVAEQVRIAREKYGYEVVGAINGSFFSMDTGTTGGRGAYGTLVNYIISNGKVQSDHAGDANEVVAFASDGTFQVVNSCIDYQLYINGEGVGSLYYVNKTSGTKEKDNGGNDVSKYWSNGFYYYDTSCGRKTDTSPYVQGYNVLCKKLDNTDLIVGGTLKGEVISVTEGTDGAQFSETYTEVSDEFDIFVRSDSPNARYVKDLQPGDSVNIAVTETVEASREIIENASSVVNNVGWLVKDGVDQTQIKSTIGTHSVTLKARWTAFGRKADGSYVFFTTDSTVTAGGSYSTGDSPCATLRDVAKAMIGMGCVDVIRMDGGGSVAMYAGGEVDDYLMVLSGYVRPVSDCILIVKKSSAVDADLNTALANAAADAKGAETIDAAVQQVLDEIDALFEAEPEPVSSDARRLLMKLQSALSGKDELNSLLSKALGISFSDYSEEILEKIRAAYAVGSAVYGNDSATAEEVASATDELRYWLALSGEQDLVLSYGKQYTVTLPKGVSNYTNFNGVLVDDGKRLVDGKKNSTEGTSVVYSAWQGAPEIVVDLGEKQKIDKFVIHSARMLDWGISTPYKFTVLVSNDGENYTEVGTETATNTSVESGGVTRTTSEMGELAAETSPFGWNSYKITLQPEKQVKARYVKFKFVTTGSFVWLDEIEVVRSVTTVQDAIYITGYNKIIYTDDCSIFDSAVGNLDNGATVNAKWTQNVFLQWSEEDGCYIVTANSFGNGKAPNRTLGEGELLLAVHGDSGGAGNINRNRAAKLKVGDKIGLYGVDVEGGKLAIAPFAKLIVEEEPDDPWGPGDVNGDGKINLTDYAMTKRCVLNTFELTPEQFARADVNGDGKVTLPDYAMIKRHVLNTYDIPGAIGKRA